MGSVHVTGVDFDHFPLPKAHQGAGLRSLLITVAMWDSSREILMLSSTPVTLTPKAQNYNGPLS